MKKYIITLTKEEDALRDITCKGTHQAQKILKSDLSWKVQTLSAPGAI